MHCNLRPPEPRQPFPELITTSCQVWSRWTYPLSYYSVFAADTLLYAETLTTDLWPWTFAMYRLWCDETLYQTWTQSSNPRRSYCDFSVWPYDLEHCITRCIRLWDNFHQVWPSTTYPCLNYGVFMLIRYVTLWPWPLTRWPLIIKVYGTSSVKWNVRNLSKIEQSPTELLIILRIFAHVMSRCHLDLWPLDLEHLHHFGRLAFKLCTKLERNRITHGWVIDDLALFCLQFSRWGTTDKRFSKDAWTNFNKLSEDIGRSFLHKVFVSAFGYLAAFSNASGSNLSDVENDAKFCKFWPPAVKIRGGMGEISILTADALPTTEPPKYIWWPFTAWLLSTVDW